MIKNIFLFLLLVSGIANTQQTFWTKTNGPYGGIVENIFFDQYRSIVFIGTPFDGIYYSTDYGERWDKASLNNITVHRFGSSDSILIAGSSEGLYRSNDDGLNWTEIDGDFSNSQILDVLILDNGYIFVATSGLGIYVSLDNGVSWEQKNVGLNNYSINCFSVDTNDMIYVGTAGSGLYNSTNFGGSWNQINSPGNNIRTISSDVNGDIYCITGGDLYYSNNYGTNWTNISISVPNATFWDLILTDSLIFGATWGQGIYLTSNNGNDWMEINNGISGSDLFVHNIIIIDTVICAATNGGGLKSGINVFVWQEMNQNLSICITRSMFNIDNLTYVGTHQSGLYYTSNNGETWEEVSYNFQSYILSSTVNSFGHIFLGTINSGIFRSTDYGANWINVGLSNYGIKALTTNSLDYIFAGTESNGVYFSNNNGGNWQVINNGLLDLHIKDMKIGNMNKVYLATQAGVYNSTNNGSNWQLAGLQNKNISRIYIQNADTIFACTYGEVYKSTDGGSNWVAINVGLPNSEINDITINANDEIYVATGQGVYRSFDGGVNWNSVNDGLTNTNVSSLVINENNLLFCGTGGGGVFKSSMPSLVREDDNNFTDSYYLSQNYPNPFNPITTIKFTIPLSNRVVLKVFNILGEEMKTLTNEFLQAGGYEINFDASNFVSGVYLYRIQTGEFSSTKKLVIIK